MACAVSDDFLRMNRTHPPPPPAPTAGSAATGDGAGPQVRDLPLRLFHWSMVACVAVAGVTGFLAPPKWLDVHVYAGYGLGLLLAFRIAWGGLGSHYSRFASFSLSLPAARDHLRAVFAKHTEDHAGHNPLGAWMIILLLVVLAIMVASGLVVLGGQEHQGPLAAWIGYQTGRSVKELHEFAAWVLLSAIAVHLLGVFVEVRVLRHPVLTAMVTGRKRGLAERVPAIARWTSLKGAALFVGVAVALIGGGAMLAAVPAGQTVRYPAIYKSECGSCHAVYHPSLRTGQTWRRMIGELADHYGEDASLDAKTGAVISEFLNTNAAEKFETKVAWRIGRAEVPSLRMTDTGYWKRRHRDIAEAVFKSRAVGSKVNCNACHADAASGLFAIQAAEVPDGAKN